MYNNVFGSLNEDLRAQCNPYVDLCEAQRTSKILRARILREYLSTTSWQYFIIWSLLANDPHRCKHMFSLDTSLYDIIF